MSDNAADDDPSIIKPFRDPPPEGFDFDAWAATFKQAAQHAGRTQILGPDGVAVAPIRVDDLAGDTRAARILPRRPRWLHRLHAALFCYFWLPCPLCGREFGGHESGGALYPDYGSSGGTSICLDCARTADTLRHCTP